MPFIFFYNSKFGNIHNKAIDNDKKLKIILEITSSKFYLKKRAIVNICVTTEIFLLLLTFMKYINKNIFKNHRFLYYLMLLIYWKIPLSETLMDTMEDDYSIVHVYNAQTVNIPDVETTITPFPAKNEHLRRPENCSTDTAIIDKLLNGTGYNKYRIPGKYQVVVYFKPIF